MKIKYNGKEYEPTISKNGHVIHEGSNGKIFFGFAENNIIQGEVILEAPAERAGHGSHRK